jgi:adenylylsulfate kinase-like enzyme
VNPPIQITISGVHGSGKSTVAMLIVEALRAAGMAVTMVAGDDEDINPADLKARDYYGQRIAAIAASTQAAPIEIASQSIQRGLARVNVPASEFMRIERVTPVLPLNKAPDDRPG